VHVHVPSQSTLIALVQVAGLFLAAWAISRVAGRLAEALVRRRERRADATTVDTGTIIALKRHETAVSLVRTTLRYAVFGIALVVSLALFSDTGRLTAVAGASLFVLLIGFAAQRFLTDILAGFFMFFEGWFSVGDNVTLEPWGLQGVVDEMGLRSTRLRAVNGDSIRIGNSQITAARVLPSATREVALELFCTDEGDARDLIERVSAMVPAGPTRFVTPPWVSEVEQLDGDLVRIQARASVAHGREWLAEDLLPSLIAERAPEGLVVHGPVVMHSDQFAAPRYARSAGRRRTTTA
jgi:moderate conductance mechanosensitive channel